MGRIDEILEAPVAVADPDDPVSPPASAGGAALEVRGLTFAYPGRAEPALRDVSFTVRAGERVAVVGRTGSGKTTLLSLIPRLWSVADGSIFLDGVDVNRLRLGPAARGHRLRPPGDLPLLRHPRGEHRPARSGGGRAALPEVQAAGELAQFADDVKGFPDGWRTLVGERGITLSGGQKQRAAIARALLRRPRLLILDDALSSVDTETEERILDGVMTADPERTVLFVSHRLSTMRRADRILVFDDGAARRVRDPRGADGRRRRVPAADRPAAAGRGTRARGPLMRHDHLIDEIEPRGFDRALLRRLLGYLAPYRGQMALSILLLFGAALLQLVGPYLVKVGIDRYISAGDLAGLDRVALLFIAAALAGFALRYAQTLLTYRIGQRAMLDLRLAVFDRIEAQSLSYFDRNPTGRLMTRVGSDVEVLQELFSSGAITIFGDLFTVIGVVAAMLAINWRLALVSFAVLPLLFGATILFRSRVRRSFRAIRQKVARMNSFLNEHLSGIAVVKLFSRERAAAARFESINDEHRQAFLGAVQAYAVFFPVVEFIGALAVALLLGYGGVQIIGGTLSFGSLVAFLEYVQRFYKPVQDLAEKFNILQSAMAAAERIFGVLDSEPEITDPAAPAAAGRARGAVEFRDVSFSYKPGEPILRNISLKIDPGEMVAIVGATGAGKSSIISLLGAPVRPAVGSGAARRPRHPRVRPEPPAPADGGRAPGRLPLLGDGPRATSRWATRQSRGKRSRRRRGASARTRSSAVCRRGTRRRSASAARCSRSARSSCSRSPGRSPTTRRCSSSTRRPPRSIRRAKR